MDASQRLSRCVAQFNAALEARAVLQSQWDDNQLAAAALQLQLASSEQRVEQARTALQEAVVTVAGETS